MPINFSDLNPGKRFIWPQSNDDQEEWVEFRLVPDEMNREFFKKIGAKPSRQVVFDNKTRQAQVVKDFELNDKQQEEFAELTWDYSITDWFFVDPKGEEIPCTKENKLRLMKGSPIFSAWVNDCLESIKEDLKIIKEDSEKN